MGLSWPELEPKLKNGIIVSVQASPNEPLYDAETLERIARSVLSGGACALRMANTVGTPAGSENLASDSVGYFKARHPETIVIGISKPYHLGPNTHQQVYITPGFSEVSQLVKAGSDIIALDATLRPRPDGIELAQLVERIREAFPEKSLMADVATLEEGLNAAKLGFEVISTTLSGYTESTIQNAATGPDFALLKALVDSTETPVVLEGRVWHPNEVSQAFELGALAVVIGSAITRPHQITQRFVAVCPQ